MLSGFNFAPRFWALCNGQVLPIAQNTALFSLLGTQYGGNGTNNFALPDLRGRTPVGFASSADPGWQPPSVQLGEVSGTENVTLLATDLPAHNHQPLASTTAATHRIPNGRLFGQSNAGSLYAAATPNVPLNAQSVAPSGANQAHPNMQPYSVVNFCVALAGTFPSRN